MGKQLFGSVETAYGTASAMLCIDDDQPDQFMIHIWGPAVANSALLMAATRDGELVKLIPTVIFRVSEQGHIYIPSEADLTQEEKLFKTHARVNLVDNGKGGYTGEWTDSQGATRTVRLDYTNETDSDLEVVSCATWSEFKSWADDARTKHHCVSFRGHGNNKFRLATTLSRVGRNRVDRYCVTEFPHFKSLLEASMNMRFDLDNNDDYATVMGLAQHHGLPTPLLDWTLSPYVAAFFALSDAIEMARGDAGVKFVRVFGLTQGFIGRYSPPSVVVSAHQPYVCSLVISPRYNQRLLAQQGQFLVTNISNVESYIKIQETKDEVKYLYAVDIPITAAPEALEDLAFMGLTAATMFPGLDGVGKMIRHQMLFKTAKVSQ